MSADGRRGCHLALRGVGTEARNARSEVRRRRARLQLWASGIVGVVIMSFGAGALLISEPDEYGSFALGAGAFMAGSVAAVALLVIGVHSGSWVAWTLPVAATLAAVVAASSAEELHWRWSRDGCKVGWWSVDHIEMSDALVEVWLPYSSSCYSGHALVRPLDRSLGATGVHDQLSVTSNYISVSEWRDEWYTVCITS
jgi:hypothetical protein